MCRVCNEFISVSLCCSCAVEKISAGGRSTLTLWDLGGEASFRSVWERYYREATVVVFVIDATQRARLPEARAELERLARHVDLHDAPLLVVANWCDHDDDDASSANANASASASSDAPAAASTMTVDELVRALPLLTPAAPGTPEIGSSRSSGVSTDADGNVERGFVARRSAHAQRLVQLLRVSAKTGAGVQQLLLWLLDLCTKTERSARLQADAARQG